MYQLFVHTLRLELDGIDLAAAFGQGRSISWAQPLTGLGPDDFLSWTSLSASAAFYLDLPYLSLLNGFR